MQLDLSRPRPAATQPKRVLLAWETGSGRTHYGNLLSVGRHLRKAGVECLATLQDLSAADREFAAIGVRTVQAFVWPGQKRLRGAWQAPAVNGFTDLLAMTGFARSDAIAACIAHYDGLFSLFQPDLILADQAYGAVLAGRDHLPVIAMASVVHFPPIVANGFPLLPGRDVPGVPIERLLHSINVGLGKAGRFPLHDIADILRHATIAPIGPAEFDIYRDVRKGRVLPPLVPGVPKPESIGERSEIFVYLHHFAQADAALMAALAEIELPMRIYIPGMSEETRQRLGRHIIHDEPVPVEQIVTRSRCVVHQGGVQLASVCVATGTPQVILAEQIDNRIAAAFVEAEGIGEGRNLGEATSEWILAAIRRAYLDADLQRACRAAAPTYYARWFSQDTAVILAQYALERMGVAEKGAAPV